MAPKVKSKSTEIDFDAELQRGHRSYDHSVGDWWIEQSSNEAHDEAYLLIAKHIRERLPIEPKLIIDYACGPGSLILALLELFPEARVIGIDGSSKMLDRAAERVEALGEEMANRVEFWESDLPNFELPAFEADLCVFCFPNICPNPDDQPYYDENGAKSKRDVAVAKYLSKAREEDPELETVTGDSKDLFNSLIDAKVVSRNLRHLVNDEGWCARVEYANAGWDELTDLVQMRMRFEQGALGKKLAGKRPKKIFTREFTDYYPSEVIEDVYHQTGDETDAEGGYFVTLLKACE